MQQNESIKSAIKRLRGACEIALDKSRFEQCLVDLRERNNDLATLRSQINAFQLPSVGMQQKSFPSRITSIQNASQKLHEALCTAWCCDEVAHRDHCAKLCFDAEVGSGVLLNLAISCQEAAAEKTNQ